MKYLVLLGLTIIGMRIRAQSPETMEKLEAAKIAFITERLELTPQEAEKFWPIYREYMDKQKLLQNEFSTLKASYDPKTATDEDNQKILNAGMAIKQKMLDLDKTYTERMKTAISTQQIVSLQKAEQDFRQMLLQRIKDQQQERQQQNDRLMNEENIRRKRTN